MTDFPAMNLKDVQMAQTGKIETKTMNELRAALYVRGIEYSDNATKADLIGLLSKKK